MALLLLFLIRHLGNSNAPELLVMQPKNKVKQWNYTNIIDLTVLLLVDGKLGQPVIKQKDHHAVNEFITQSFQHMSNGIRIGRFCKYCKFIN